MEKKSISRRSFLKLFGAGTVAATATLAGAPPGKAVKIPFPFSSVPL